MNPGLLTVPFCVGVVYLGLRRHPLVLAVWPFCYLVLLTVRTKIGGGSLYWSDVAALAVLLGFWLPWRRRRRTVAESWGIALLLSLTLGALSTVVRHHAVLQPGFLLLRWALAFAPFFVLPRILGERKWMKSFTSGVVLGAVTIGAVAMLQGLSPGFALFVDGFFYGDYSYEDPTSFSSRAEHIMLNQGLRRMYAMYGNSTVLAGAGLLAALLGWVLAELSPRLRFGYLAVPPALLASLLSYSRHAMLALGVFLVAFVVLDRRRSIGPLVVLGGVLLALVLGVLSSDVIGTRLARGGIFTDENLRMRLIEGPRQLTDRLTHEPSIGLVGIGLGTEHLPAAEEEGALHGFVSNSFLLHLFFGGLVPLLVFCAAFVVSISRALRLPSPWRAAFAATLLAAAVVLASDNYGYFHYTITFMWSSVMALALHLSATELVSGERREPPIAERRVRRASSIG